MMRKNGEMKKNILITNDDGILSDGIVRLARAAARIGNVTVIAPDKQCSAMSHRITLLEPIDVKKVAFPVEDVKAYAISGTPGDCIRIAIFTMLKEKPDYIFSGINHGYNCGTDLQYSATAAAALEGAANGVPSIAFSEGADGVHEVSDAFLEKIMDELIEKPLEGNKIWNVNFPECRMEDYKGILYDRKIAGNAFYTDSYEEEIIDDQTIRMHLNGVYEPKTDKGTDVTAVMEGYISVGIVNNIN